MKRGRVVLERFESAVLRGNPAGDPAERTVPVYLPPSYDDSPATRYPVAFVLTARRVKSLSRTSGGMPRPVSAIET